MLAVILGLIFVAAGGFGVFVWYGDFLVVIKGLMPFTLAVGGVISVIAGVTSIVESFEPKDGNETPPAENKQK